MKVSRVLPALSFVVATALRGSAAPSPKPAEEPSVRMVSPEVHADGRVTFRFRAGWAKEVSLELDGARSAPMKKDAQGIWTLTTEPLAPDFYGYLFNSGGSSFIDPVNPSLKPNLLETQSLVHVPGPASLPWEVGPFPRGEVHHHFYRSSVVGDERDFFVYTPPGYEARSAELYPVLYLLHGFGDDARAWVSVGRANVIFDNLIAQHKVRPMIVVMPFGYGAPEMLADGFGSFRDANLRKRNLEKFQSALLGEVIPWVEHSYRVGTDRDWRAIAGASMGGAEALLTGLNHLDRFAAIGAFSAGGVNAEFDAAFPGLDGKASSGLRLLWIACGADDSLIDINRKLTHWLTAKGVQHTSVETPGAHTWMLWRRHLASFAPRLFVAPSR